MVEIQKKVFSADKSQTMLFKFYTYFKQLPLAVRWVSGMALGAVFIFLIVFTLNHYYSVPREANFLPSDCKVFARFNSNEGVLLEVSKKLLFEGEFASLAPYFEGRQFSFCHTEGGSIFYVKNDDKNIERSILENGFNYKKITKNGYIIYNYPIDFYSTKNKLSSKLRGNYRNNDQLFLYFTRETIDSQYLLPVCEGKKECMFRAKVVDDGLQISSKSFSKTDFEELGNDFEFLVKNKNLVDYCNGKEKSGSIIPLWAQMIGAEDYENFLCSKYILGFKDNGKEDFSSPWKSYSIYLKLKLNHSFTDDEKINLENYLKKSIAYLFPKETLIVLNDGSKVKEIEIDSTTLQFSHTTTHSFINFPDNSAVIYYKINQDEAVITNNIELLELDMGIDENILLSKTNLVKEEILFNFLSLFEYIMIKNNSIFLK